MPSQHWFLASIMFRCSVCSNSSIEMRRVCSATDDTDIAIKSLHRHSIRCVICDQALRDGVEVTVLVESSRLEDDAQN
jgi:hypothetical protein